MKRQTWVVIISLISLLLIGGLRAAAAPTRSGPVIDPALATTLSHAAPDQRINVIVILNDQVNVRSLVGRDRAERQRTVINALRAKADATQTSLRTLLRTRQGEGQVETFTPLWIVNAIAVRADRSVIEELSRLPEVRSIVPDAIILAPASSSAYTTTSTPEANIGRINAPAVWNLGFQGQGVVIGSMDTGVDYTHPDLSAQWRGGSNSWYDPYGQHPTMPTDVNGHGTWTMGVMVGRDNGGTAIGVAPQAKWIAVKMFNDGNTATSTAIHQGYQWLLDPDHNSQTADAPDVVNNSWTLANPGCDLSFESDLQALVAAGITPVFAAGNSGPNSSTSYSPANNPDALAAGATDNSDVIYPYSSRGPTSCGSDGTTRTFPNVVAPGVNIRTTDLYGGYSTATGTSLAAPHVSGALALLLSAFPNLTVSQQEIALTSTSLDLGLAGPDNTYGAGRIDVLAAYNAVASGALPTPTPTPLLPTATLAPTPTNTPVPPTPTNTPLPPTPTATPSDVIFADGFDSGNLAVWSSTGGTAGRLSVVTAAKQAGSYGLQATISSGTSGYVVDNSPNNETSYHARFYFHPNSAAIISATQDIFDGLNASGQTVFQIQLRLSGGAYQIRAVISRKGGASNTDWYTISNAYHAIEIAWQSGSGASFSLYLDGSLKQTVTKLNTGTYTIRSARLGPSAGLSGSSGSEYFDSFVSTRSRTIGP